MESVIEIRDLFHAYGAGKKKWEALRGITLTVKKGGIFGFLGPNGAGKTTTIKLLLGILTPQIGTLSVFGGIPAIPRTRMKIGYMPEIADYYRYLTPGELLYMYGDIFGIDRKILTGRINELLEMVGISESAGRQMRTFSRGMKQKVSFAQALINDPDLLILDEPTGGLDPIARKKMREVMISLRDKNKTVFFSSHELSEVELVSDRVAILNKGRVLKEGLLSGFLSAKGEKQTLEGYFLEIIEGSEKG
ncbi:MAG: ABC transporter ATP-binding protein [Candidatus Omnitrophica bacterium]|nr:ABC transporter ATP-binding protein [Candidatus Omnitrophota bacterium]MBU1127915.1 ABC transporter ATP-binding protein [Candidatus Omnitrophota bacterium]MBU1784312.1 ABC transporter ATP-binding protein [Candidatus Omnitrophota bacterium]MBU1851598.1 ABC transporter ATP-binding protein [Candidatus Omnitrophota bacterium]